MATTISPIATARRVHSSAYADFPVVNVVEGDLAYGTDTTRLYRWDGAAWQPITSEGAEGHITILPWDYNAVVQGTWVIYVDSTQIMNGNIQNSTQANGDELNYKVFLVKGTYTLQIVACKISAAPILKFYLDGVEKMAVDLYSAADVQNFVTATTGIAVATNSLRTISVKADGKNAGSSAYKIKLSSIALWRTA